MTLTEMSEGMTELLLGGALGAIFGAMLAVGVFLSVAVYIYHALAWQKIARESKHKHPWLAWIPFANFALILQLGQFHWAWIFLFLVPILGWIAVMVLIIIATWRVYENRKYPGWFSLAPIIPKIGGLLYLIALGFVTWKNMAAKKRK